jgi:hypothetical protein
MVQRGNVTGRSECWEASASTRMLRIVRSPLAVDGVAAAHGGSLPKGPLASPVRSAGRRGALLPCASRRSSGVISSFGSGTARWLDRPCTAGRRAPFQAGSPPTQRSPRRGRGGCVMSGRTAMRSCNPLPRTNVEVVIRRRLFVEVANEQPEQWTDACEIRAKAEAKCEAAVEVEAKVAHDSNTTMARRADLQRRDRPCFGRWRWSSRR